jgi:FPC/CPF motif-containing protein YcgG
MICRYTVSLLNGPEEGSAAIRLGCSLVYHFDDPAGLNEQSLRMPFGIQSLADKDHWPSVRLMLAEIRRSHFRSSFGGQTYFVVGLHPAASRPARRFCASSNSIQST